MNLPFDWPRINCWPEWFDVAAATLVTSEGLAQPPQARDLEQGLPLKLPPHARVVLRFRENGGASESARR